MHELDILNDDVLSTADDAKTLTLDDTSGALTNKGLVGGDGHTQDTGVIAGGGENFAPFYDWGQYSLGN